MGKKLFIAILSLVPAFLFAQELIPLNLEWEYDFGDSTFDYISRYKLCDPDSDDVPDLFCVHGASITNSWKISRLTGDELVWLAEDFEFYPRAMEIIDMDRDGINTLWFSGWNDTLLKLNELDLENGDILLDITLDYSHTVYTINSILMAEDSTVYPLLGSGYTKEMGWGDWSLYDFGNVIRLDPTSFSIIDSLYQGDDDYGKFINFINYSPMEFSGEKLIYDKRKHHNSYYGTGNGSIGYADYYGMINEYFDVDIEAQIYSVATSFEGSCSGGIIGQVIPDYFYNSNHTLALNYGYSWFDINPWSEGSQYCIELYSLPDLVSIWEINDTTSFGNGLYAVDLTDDDLDELLTIGNNNITAFNVTNGEILGYSENFTPATNKSAAIGTSTGLDLYLIQGEKVYKYSGGFLSANDKPDEQAPIMYDLYPAYPNPFNPTTTIKFDIDRSSEVNLSVFNIAGEKAAVLADGRYEAGRHEVKFDGSELSSGLYFVVMNIGDGKFQTQKIVLLK